MKYLVTGGAGFIGEYVVKQLLENKHNVVVVDNLSSGKAEKIPNDAKFYQVDIRDEAKVSEIFVKEKPDYVIHLAAQVSVSNSMQDPGFDADVNILGSINIFQQSLKNRVKKVVVASSSAVYGEQLNLPVKENAILNPINYYGLSKLVMERYLELFAKQFGLDYTILRFSNVFGIGQKQSAESGVITIILESILSKKLFSIFGSGEQTRDFVYVKDVANSAITACSKDVKLSNVSTARAVTLNELINMISSVFGVQANVIRTDARLGDIKHSSLDNTILRENIIAPKYTLESGLKEMKEVLGS